MKAATIVPISLLKETKKDDYFMCLAQFIGENQPYTQFYQDRIAEGKFVIMDNGAAEGHQPSIEELIPKIQLLNPCEVVLPDTIGDSSSTLAKGSHALQVLHQEFGSYLPFKVMVVPQGETFRDWVACAMEMVLWKVQTIGVSKFTTKLYDTFYEPRLLCVATLLSAMRQREAQKLAIHLLGCWNRAEEVNTIERTFPHTVRGCDSALAYVYTKGNKLLETDDRPSVEIDFINGTLESQQDLRFIINKTRWVVACHGNL